ncbi:hypothetical protein [Sphingomonas sp. PB1R3]|uniref:hypothetical protein n=1 Tax=Sphingomonas flavida TaxID=3096154 RepID=UPI002FC7431F
MTRRHSLPMILTIPVLALAACSPQGSANVTATDNGNVATLGGDGLANDDFGPADNAALSNDVLSENETAANGAAGL